MDPTHLIAKIHGGHHPDAHLSSEALGLLLQLHHHGRSVHTIGVSGEIINFGSGGQLTAGFHSGIHHRLQVGSGSIDRSCITRRPRSNDQTFYSFYGIRHNVILSNKLVDCKSSNFR